MSNILIDVLGETCYHIHLTVSLYIAQVGIQFCLITMFLKDVKVEFK